jgi:hypothetical protein
MILHFHAAGRIPAHIATYNPQAASGGEISEELLQHPIFSLSKSESVTFPWHPVLALPS